MTNKQIHTISSPIKPVVLGEICSAYGICGWLKVFSLTEKAESIFNYLPWFIKKAGKWQQIKLENWKGYNQSLIIKLKDIEDRNAATLLTNYEIIIDASQLPGLSNDEYYWKDLMGCRVMTISGCRLGKVINLIKTGSNDVLVVKDDTKNAVNIQERLIPFLNNQVIKNVNLVTRAIDVDWEPSF